MARQIGVLVIGGSATLSGAVFVSYATIRLLPSGILGKILACLPWNFLACLLGFFFYALTHTMGPSH
jgi:hypothetical protein